MAKLYLVTVTPKIKVYAGAWSNGEYTERMVADSANEAIKRVRRSYNDCNDVPATYKAKVIKD
jgi:hypothetical protein